MDKLTNHRTFIEVRIKLIIPHEIEYYRKQERFSEDQDIKVFAASPRAKAYVMAPVSTW